VVPPHLWPHAVDAERPQLFGSFWKLVQYCGVPVPGHWLGYWLVVTHRHEPLWQVDAGMPPQLVPALVPPVPQLPLELVVAPQCVELVNGS